MPAAPIKRLVPDEPLPPYAYVPGRQPHPLNDPAGHSYGRPLETAPPLEPQRWRESRAYLLGCDLFNAGYYWEAHETWEAAWAACGRSGATADFLKGLIKLAAAAVKAREGKPPGVARHAKRAAELLSRVRELSGRASYAGLNLDALVVFARRLQAEGVSVEPSGAAVQVIVDLQLLPSE
jgi:hypothetical protein